MDNRSAEVNSVIPGSIAEEAGIEKGDCILSINNENISDVFDYRFLTINEELNLEIRKMNGEIWEVEIEKDEYEDLGIEFESFMMDEARSCTNKCIFCFIDQLPKGMRETLYFKDDDSRLSFLTGNYVTLTNISDEELERIIHYRMSPINVSVHTTNLQLRAKMLSNRFAVNILERIKKFVDGGITLNCQIVLCRGINDGEELNRTLFDLTGFYPGVNSISIVPVGLTKHRQGLEKLIPYDNESSKEVLALIDTWQQKMINRYNSRIVYPADEFFIMSGQEIPEHDYYEDFPQIENGVGLIALFKQQFDEYLASMDYKLDKKQTVSIATGVSAAS
jgi:putative radical SAM enzyme (TIGR03279 family)